MSQVPFTIGCLGWHIFHTRGVWELLGLDQSRSAQPPPEMVNWLNENVRGGWAHGANHYNMTISLFIRDAREAMMFKLTWHDEAPKLRFRETG